MNLDVMIQPSRIRIVEQTPRENPGFKEVSVGTCHSKIFRDAGSCSDLELFILNFFKSEASPGIA
jgi:hypothetical protein